jgi:hypothetical protein
MEKLSKSNEDKPDGALRFCCLETIIMLEYPLKPGVRIEQ